jgi:hypothetical protein
MRTRALARLVNTAMITNSVRNLTALVLWLAIAFAALYLNVQVTTANYLGCKAALEKQGYEPEPLGVDPLVGRFLGAFLDQATLAQFVALGVALVEALALFLLFHTCFELWRLFQIRGENQNLIAATQKQSGNAETEPVESTQEIETETTRDAQAEVRAANRLILRAIVEIALLALILIPVIRWDIDLIRFRAVVDALGNGSPEINPMQIPSWTNFLSTNDHLFITRLIGNGAWGYLGVTALGCLLLELSFEKLDQRWARLMSPVDKKLDGWLHPEPEAIFYGYDETGQPVYEPDTPVSYDLDGRPVMAVEDVRADTSEADDEETIVRPVEASAGSKNPSRPFADWPKPQAESAPVGSGNGNGNGYSPLFDSSAIDQPRTSEEWPHVVYESPETRSSMLDVIGTNSDRVSLATAQADPSTYYVDQVTGQVWNRKHWESLHGIANESEAPTTA